MAALFDGIDVIQFLIDCKKVKSACSERRSGMLDPCADCPLSKGGVCRFSRYQYGKPVTWTLPDMMITADDKAFLNALGCSVVIRRSSDGSLAMYDGDYRVQLNPDMFEMIDRGRDYTTDQLKTLEVIGADESDDSGISKWLRGWTLSNGE